MHPHPTTLRLVHLITRALRLVAFCAGGCGRTVPAGQTMCAVCARK